MENTFDCAGRRNKKSPIHPVGVIHACGDKYFLIWGI